MSRALAAATRAAAPASRAFAAMALAISVRRCPSSIRYAIAAICVLSSSRSPALECAVSSGGLGLSPTKSGREVGVRLSWSPCAPPPSCPRNCLLPSSPVLPPSPSPPPPPGSLPPPARKLGLKVPPPSMPDVPQICIRHSFMANSDVMSLLFVLITWLIRCDSSRCPYSISCYRMAV